MSMVGKTLGNFECTDLIGRGGMGEVYKAKDQKLGRDVAIKVLPEEFAKDADRVARFQREAKLLASLNHPNIAAIHGFEEAEGIHFLVLELIEGDTLADRLKRGALPVEESLKLALQIAEALEAAHEKGVIHRDLKPSNLKVTPDGKVKILDFGLAKAFSGDQGDRNLSNSPTLSVAATQEGVILGTAAYMSPEQARGNPVDKRADIWAFGIVLFEMLTGGQVFSEDTVSDTLASVLKSEPSWQNLPLNLHPRIRFLLERCLQKDFKNRYSGISDARVDIQEAMAGAGGALQQPTGAAETGSRLRQMLLCLAAAFLMGGILIGAAVWNLRKPESNNVISFDHDLPADQQFSFILQPFLAVSPDGMQFAYSTTQGIYLRSLDDRNAKLLNGSDNDNPRQPFFSPDGQWVGYWSQTDGQLKKIAISGGAPISISNHIPTGSLSWREDDTILFSQADLGVLRISANGDSSETLIKSENQAFFHPRLLPGEEVLIFTLGTEEGYRIAVQSLESGERTELFPGAYAQYLPTGHLIYTHGNDLLAIPFDLKNLKTTGGGFTLAEDVFQTADGAPQYALSESGVLIYASGKDGSVVPLRKLVWVDLNGNEEPLSAAPNGYCSPRISPDGTKIAWAMGKYRDKDLWIWDLVRETPTRLTRHEANIDNPVWTPDGKRIAFFSNRDSYFSSIYWIEADSTGQAEFLGSVQDRWVWPCFWSADGKTLVLSEMDSIPSFDIGMLSIENERTIKALVGDDPNEIDPRLSPDGNWMAYASDESGQFEVYVRSFPEVEGFKQKVSTTGGDSPLWSPDGRSLYYRSGDTVMAVAFHTGKTIGLDKPKVLFQGNYVSFSIATELLDFSTWDISPDGRRFLMMKEVEPTDGESATEGPRQINVTLNWFETLKKSGTLY